MHIPLGPMHRALSLTTSWPTMPISWPDARYGIGPFLVCNRNGSEGQPHSDYRMLRLQVKAGEKMLDLLPMRDAQGCADADDALYTDQFYDQTLSDVTHRVLPGFVRQQPRVVWREDLPLIDATVR